ncbi:MAG TPA: trehalose-phosphatase [Thermoanaerobaculia bacterium]|nr:trehalose-phosphatase [Thermoanaerobaculia bacterium]
MFSAAPSRVLLADYDGTLAPFRSGRDIAAPYAGVAELLSEIAAARRTRLVLVSGRAVSDLGQRVRWLRPRPELWGSHGLERMTPEGRLDAPPVSRAIAELLEDVARWTSARGAERLFERKPYGFALHERPDPVRYRRLREAVLARWSAPACRAGLVLGPFDGGIEFRPEDANKGRVVRTILEEEKREAAVAYLGDDATDEDAFAALRGRGLAVLVRSRRRESAAAAWLRPPEELRDFLLRWLRAEPAAPARSGKDRR